MKSYDKFDDRMFANETQTGMYIDRLYYDFFSAYKSPIQNVVGSYTDTRTRSTEEIGGTITDYINPQKTLVNATDADAYYGQALSSGVNNNPYTRIRNINVLLAKANDASTAAWTTQFRKTAKGQAYFLRALQYFDLVRVYGGVPIVTTVETAVADDESIKHPRAKTSECIAQIIKDLDSASSLLPANWDASNWGRFTSASALAMKSRVLLTYASPLFNPDWDNAGNDRWQKALDAGLAAETALTAAGYGLYGSSAKDWAEMWYTDAAVKKEGIMIRMLSNSTASSGIESNGWERSIRVTKQTGGGGISAPKEMIDMFPLADGSRPVIGTNYNDTFFFMNRDPRFYRTFAFSGMKWPTKEAPTDTVWLYRWTYTGNKVAYSDGNSVSSPAVVRKMTNPTGASTVAGLAFSGTDIMEYRYAELLLNIAECYAAQGNIASCITYLGKIRQRVGIPAGSNNYGIGTLSSKYAAIEAVLYERRVELAYEGKRYWDLQRWMLYSDAATGDNTNAKLGIAQLNGTARTGRYWQYKNTASNANDPLINARKTFLVDPDASDFATQLNNLKSFFQTNLKVVGTDQPMDKDGSGQGVLINYRPNYYLSGLNATALSTNPWLTQTIGWNDYNGVPGTYDYKQ